MIGYIYIVTCNVNNKRYIGRKTSSIFLGEKYLGSGLHVKRAVQEYGKENFTVQLLEECGTVEELIEREAFWIKYFNAVESENFYNHSPEVITRVFYPEILISQKAIDHVESTPKNTSGKR